MQRLPGGAARSNNYMRETASSLIMLTFCSPFMIKKHIAGPGLSIQFAMPKGQGKPILFLNPNSLKLSYEATKQTAAEIEAAFRFLQEAMGI